jgi:hypothetical protein
MEMEISEVQKRTRDIKNQFESIRSSWVEVSKTLGQKEASELRKSIETDLAELEDLLWDSPQQEVISN